MRELDAILHAWRGLEGPHRDSVLATVVHVRGSAYRRPGARMLIVPDGQRVGCVSGGCLEGDIARTAWWFTESGVPVVRVYDTTSTDDAVWEFGLGCNGVVQVMLERIAAPGAREMLEFLDVHRTSGTPAVVATVIRTPISAAEQVGDRLLVDKASVAGGALAGSQMQAEVLAHASEALRERKTRLAHVGGTQVLVEWVGPALSLVVFGAGHDAVPLVAFAAQLGWSVTVADGRPAYARAARFPGARTVRMSSDDPLRDVTIDAHTAVVLMTHNYPLDARLLPRILKMQPG